MERQRQPMMFRSTCRASAPSYAPNERLNASISLWTGDIARLKVDAIVNAANPSLLGTAGGVNGSIHRQAGDRLRVSCARHLEAHGGKIPPGGIVVTPSYELPSNYIIHCVVGDDAAADATSQTSICPRRSRCQRQSVCNHSTVRPRQGRCE